ncbi:MAG: beta-N-acetylhexosaminidase, partial [Bacteroidota bacterium]|nr:beta-N-acetylhexosaminidase [Bacteroidota bacterium]
MKKYLLLHFLFAGFIANAQPITGQLTIIPQPVTVQMGNGQFVISKKTVITATNAEDRKTAGYFNLYLQQRYGFKLDIDRQEGKNYIRLSTKNNVQAPNKDSYNFSVAKDGVSIEGNTYAGTFYGVQTLIQLLPTTPDPKFKALNFSIPFVTITDYPRFAYRGMHLDVARHFFPPSFVKKYIDYLALHKMNYFHWHLTDDQGWRIEIKKYPELTTKAAYRNGTIIGRYPGTGNDNIRYGGFYTQEEVKDIVKYAMERHITVIPEIEMPGHSSAAIAAFPWLSCFPEEETKIPSHPSEQSILLQAQGYKKQVQETWGVFEDIFCAGKDSTFTFLENVLDELIPLFPSPYIHVGGDEAPKSNWKRCLQCQARIRSEGLKDEHGLQSYFIQRIEKYLNGKGKTIIGWDEILEGGLAPNAIVMSWQGEKGGIEAAQQKHTVIMTPQKPVYFDHTQTKNEDSLVIGGYNPLEAVYAYEPIPKEVNPDDAKFILGAQANVWTEYMAYPSKVEYMVFPRMSALSEVLWSPKEARDWKSFEQRLQTQFKRYDLWKANYSKAYFDLQGQVKKSAAEKVTWFITPKKKSMVRFTNPLGETVYMTGDSMQMNLTTSGHYT